MATVQPLVGSSAGPGPGPPPPRLPRRILCAIDFSPASVAVIAQAVALARACRGEITVLFVVPYAAPTKADARRLPEGIDSAITDDIEGLLEPARAAGIPVRVCLKVGTPAHEIVADARRIAADVLVMGTHGRHPLARRVLGSVATEALRHAPCPVLTIAQRRRARPPVEGPPSTTVVCAAALGPSSPRTVAYAAALARVLGGPLAIVHVRPPWVADPSPVAARLHALAAGAIAERPQRVDEIVATGDRVRHILRIATARRAALLVLGGPERGDGAEGVSCIAARIVRQARCPVLTLGAAAAERQD